MKAALMTLLPAIDAKINWDTTYGQSPERRLAVDTTASHNNTADPDCIVGGFDPNEPTRVYVGGPCSKIANGAPQDGFRYVMMQTIHAELVGKSGGDAAPLKQMTGAEDKFQFAEDKGSYARCGAGMNVHFEKPDNMTDAAMFLSVASYLAKDDFTYATNDFITGKTGGVVEEVKGVCVVPCPADNLQCTTCPAATAANAMKATKGMYKYSVMAAAFDKGAKGWANVKATYKAASGNLEGYLNVYQGIDFTHMNADTLTIRGAGSSTKWATMKECTVDTFKDVADPTKDCTVYDVVDVTVESAEWSGTYKFPTNYNYGSWSKASEAAAITPAQAGTRTAKIRGIRPSLADTQAAGIGQKAILLQYQFDVSGIDASLGTNNGYPMNGKYMVYDPTVTTGVAAPPPAAGNVSDGRIACQPVALFIMMVLVALGKFA